MADEKRYLFDNPRNVNLLIKSLYGSCAVLLLLDFVIHRHTIHSWEQLLGFYSIYGFIGCSGIIFGSKVLRYFVKRRPDYYERDDEKKEVDDVDS